MMQLIKTFLMQQALKYVIKYVNQYEDKLIDKLDNKTLRDLIDGATDGLQQAIDGRIYLKELTAEQAIKEFPKTLNLAKLDLSEMLNAFKVRDKKELTDEQKKARWDKDGKRVD